MTWIAVAAGSALGGLARYGLGGWLQARAGSGFPWGTLAVNLTGCLILGALVRWLGEAPPPTQWRLFLAIGFCGAYTTFSTFSLEVVALARDRAWPAVSAYMGVSVAGGVAALVLGMIAADWIAGGP